MRNFFTMLLISQGVPFFSQGDEFGRTQHGNNNAYCQDNEISWVDWSWREKNAGLVRFTRMMIALRKQHFALSREQFVNRVSWHGIKVGDPDWTGQNAPLAFQMHGWHWQPDLYVMFNAHWEASASICRRSNGSGSGWWTRTCRRRTTSSRRHAVPLRLGGPLHLAPRSAVILMGSR